MPSLRDTLISPRIGFAPLAHADTRRVLGWEAKDTKRVRLNLGDSLGVRLLVPGLVRVAGGAISGRQEGGRGEHKR